MPTGLGIDHVMVNGVPVGTTSTDIRRIWGALYSPGVVNGCRVTTSSTAMTYTVSPGVAVVRIANGENVIVPVPATTVTVSANGGTAARIDRVYVEQIVPGTANNIVVGVAQGANPPVNSQILAEFSASAGATTTSKSYFQGSVPYSVPYGANLGLFFSKTDTSNSIITKGAVQTIANGSFTLMTDRKCTFTTDLNVSALRPNGIRAVAFDDSAYVELTIQVYIDGVLEMTFNTPGLHQAWATYHFEENVNLLAGTHTVSFRYYYTTNNGPGTVMRHYAGTNASRGCTFAVRDGGFWESGVAGDTV